MSLLTRYQEIEGVTKYSNYYLGKCYSWLSTPITERAAAWGIHPNVLTLTSLAIAIAGCFGVATGQSSWVIWGAVLLYVSYVLDWCDGQLARFTGKVSPFGGWLDQICDRLKESAYVFSLANGSYLLAGNPHVWVWGFWCLCFLFLLEYYGQMSRAIPDASMPSAAATETAAGIEVQTMHPFPNSQRRIVVDFSIDEQYFVLVVGLLFLSTSWTLMLLTILAGLMSMYKPVRGWMRYYRTGRTSIS